MLKKRTGYSDLQCFELYPSSKDLAKLSDLLLYKLYPLTDLASCGAEFSVLNPIHNSTKNQWDQVKVRMLGT